MAGKFGSPSIFFLLDGYNLISNKLKSLRYKIGSKQENTTGLGDSWDEHTPTGMAMVELAQGGAFFDTDTNRIHAAMAAKVADSPQEVVRIACLGFAGNTVGEPFVGLQGIHTVSYEVLGTIGDLTKANVEYKGTGQLDHGVILQPLAAKTSDWNTQGADSVDHTTTAGLRVIPITSNSQANPTVVTTPVPHGFTTGQVVLIASNSGSSPAINGERTVTVISTTSFSVPVDTSAGAGGTGGTVVAASTVNGGVGYLQVTDGSGFTNFVGTFQDSADDSTYATLVACTDNVSDPFAERVTVSGTVDRYLAFDGNVTGTGTVTVFAGFARG